MSQVAIKARFAAGLVALGTICAIAYLLLWVSVLPLVRGWTPVVILSGSMAPAISTGDIVLSERPDLAQLAPGLVVVFDNPAGEGSITHRIVDRTPDGDFITMGDATRRIDSTPVPAESIRGVGRILIPFVGRPLVWVEGGQWLKFALASILFGLVVWISRWALLDEFDPWRDVARSSDDESVESGSSGDCLTGSKSQLVDVRVKHGDVTECGYATKPTGP